MTNTVDEAITWNAHRAVVKAIEKVPEIPDDERFEVEVTIRFLSGTWPGVTNSGRRKPTVLGRAACIYHVRKDETP